MSSLVGLMYFKYIINDVGDGSQYVSNNKVFRAERSTIRNERSISREGCVLLRLD